MENKMINHRKITSAQDKHLKSTLHLLDLLALNLCSSVLNRRHIFRTWFVHNKSKQNKRVISFRYLKRTYKPDGDKLLTQSGSDKARREWF